MYYDYGSGLDNLNDIGNALDSIGYFFNNAGSLSTLHNIIGILLGVGVLILFYIIYSYVYMFQGRKAGLDNDWFAFIPIVRTVYRLDMVGEDRWKMMFIGGVSVIIKIILYCLLVCFMFANSPIITVIFDIIILGYFGACLFFSYEFDRKFYKLFGFNEHYALVNLTGGLAVILTLLSILGGFIPTLLFVWWLPIAVLSVSRLYASIFTFITAFDDRCQTTRFASASDGAGQFASEYKDSPTVNKPNVGIIECTAGMYRGATFNIETDFEMVIGRDSYFSSIVINEGADTISRKHCGIRYDKSSRCYVVTDYSSNGTYIAKTKEKLTKNMPKSLPSGTSIYLGDMNNMFKLL